MTIKSETMRRMDAMAAAGLVPNMLACVDTMTVRNGQTIMLKNGAWVELYNGNMHVRMAYDADTDDAPPAQPITAAAPPLVPAFKKEDFLPAKKQLNAPAQPARPARPAPLGEETLTMYARRMAEELRDPHTPNVPDYAHMAWLLDQLATRLEAKEQDVADITNLEDTDGDPDEHQEE